MRMDAQRDADRVVAKERVLERRQEALEKRKETVNRFWDSRENAVHQKRMELENVWTKKEEKLRDERRELEKRECTIRNKELQEKICPNCGHKRPRIERQRKERLRPQKSQKTRI